MSASSMSAGEIAAALLTWTPFLAEGFLYNIGISLLTMLIGTPLGLALARARGSERSGLRRAGAATTALARNVPTFVMLFYLALVFPAEIGFGHATIPFPAWLKASVALAIAVAGFVSDTGVIALGHLRRGDRSAALLFLPAWTTYFIIIVMASSTASVIGVPEIVQRANTVVGATGQRDMMLWIYLYAMLWFLAFCWPVAAAMRLVRARLEHRAAVAATRTASVGERKPLTP
jgi:His/Glu/Gln/Arg/opine family amino acid ABC transporter permease subunit